MTDPSFPDFHLPDPLLIALERAGFTAPTPVQQRVIPSARAGRDLMVSAATGSGKTAAFLLPMLERFHDHPAPRSATRGLILAPTRELAKQIHHHFLQLASLTRLTATVITGGHPKRYQIASLRKNPDLLIATPGRLLEHLANGEVTLVDLEVLILDEADRMLDMGFAPDVLQILEVANPNRQSMLFSATLDHLGMQSITDPLLRDPERLTLDAVREQHPDIEQQVVLADDKRHKQQLLEWLTTHQPCTRAVVFANMRDTVKQLLEALGGKELRIGALHGEMDQRERNQVMDRFRRGEVVWLIATDVAARGLDVAELDLVVNFDMPRNAEELLHRTGRTGRAGERGLAISLVTAPDWNRMSSIERYLGMTFERRRIKGLEGHYRGPKKAKSSGKAAGSKREAPSETKRSPHKVKKRLRDQKNIGKRRKPSTPPQGEPAGLGPPRRKPKK